MKGTIPTRVKTEHFFLGAGFVLALIYPLTEFDLLGLPVTKVFLVKIFCSLLCWRVALSSNKFYLPILPSFLSLIAAGILSGINSLNPNITLLRVFLQIIIAYIAITVVYNLCDNLSKCKFILISMIIIGVICAILGWNNYFKGNFQAVSLFFPRVTPPAWLGGTHVSLAGLMVVLLPFVCAWLFIEQSRQIKILLGFIASLFVVTCLFTLSRIGWACLLLQALIWLWVFRRNVWLLLLSISSLLIMIFAAFSPFQELLNSRIRDSSDMARDYLAELAIRLFLQHPLLGVGFGTFTEYNNVIFDSSFNPPRALDAHGTMYKVISETGLLGLVAVCLVWISIMYRLLHAFYKAKFFTEHRIFLLGCIISFIINTLFEMFSTRFYSLQYWFPIGWSLAMANVIVADIRMKRETILQKETTLCE